MFILSVNALLNQHCINRELTRAFMLVTRIREDYRIDTQKKSSFVKITLHRKNPKHIYFYSSLYSSRNNKLMFTISWLTFSTLCSSTLRRDSRDSRNFFRLLLFLPSSRLIHCYFQVQHSTQSVHLREEQVGIDCIGVVREATEIQD